MSAFPSTGYLPERWRRLARVSAVKVIIASLLRGLRNHFTRMNVAFLCDPFSIFHVFRQSWRKLLALVASVVTSTNTVSIVILPGRPSRPSYKSFHWPSERIYTLSSIICSSSSTRSLRNREKLRITFLITMEARKKIRGPVSEICPADIASGSKKFHQSSAQENRTFSFSPYRSFSSGR